MRSPFKEYKPRPKQSTSLLLKETSLPVTSRMRTAMRRVFDPEIPINIYDLGLIYDLSFDKEAAKATVIMTLTSPNCPEAENILERVRRMLKFIPEIQEVDVQLVWDPPWSRDRMSDAAKLQLGLL